MTWTTRVRGLLLIVGSSVVLACGNGGAGASSALSPGTEAPLSTGGAASPLASAAATPSAGEWQTLLSLVACPSPRPTDPACLDATATGEVPARTTAVQVGGEVRITFTVHNAGPGVSPPITLLLFTFEPPMAPEFIQAVECGSCAIHAADIATALEWPGIAPGDERFTATLRAAGHPTEGPAPSSQKVGDDYEWLAGFFALPSSAVLGQPDGIDSGLAFALATGETTISGK